MSSISRIAKEAKQPRGGYVKLEEFHEQSFDDGMCVVGAFSISPSIVGLAVDYLTRMMLGASAEEAFEVSLKGARLIGRGEHAKALEMVDSLRRKDGDALLDEEGIRFACRLSGYDVAYRRGKQDFKPVDGIDPDERTVADIRLMAARSASFFSGQGSDIVSGFTLHGGMTDKLEAGDGDYVAGGTLWDLKCSKRKPSAEHTLQVICYWLAGMRSRQGEFADIEAVGLFNPLLNKAWTKPLSEISDEVLDEIAVKVLSYPSAQKERAPRRSSAGTTVYDVVDAIRRECASESDKGSRFERAVRFYLKNDPLWRGRLEEVWLWADAPTNDGRDIGIDLVAKDREDGAYWAIQCKCYDEESSLDYRTVATFYGAVGTGETYAHNMIVSTTEHFGPNLDRAAGKWRTVRLFLDEMAQADVDWKAFLEGSDIGQRKLFEPREYQEEAIGKCLEGFAHADRGKLVMACGTGKTLTALRLAERFCPRGRVLFLAPSISLVAQTLRVWANQAACPLRCAVVCSDAKASRTEDAWESSLKDVPFPASTDPSEIIRQVGSDNAEGLAVVFSTYQSIQAIIDAQDAGLADFDLCICDEAHRTTGARDMSDSKEDESAFTKVHDANALRARKRLYMTATPRVYGTAAKRKAHEESYELSSMDDEEKYGKELYRLSFGCAVEKGLLADYRVLILTVSEAMASEVYQQMMAAEEGFDVPEAAKILGCWKGLTTRGERMCDLNLQRIDMGEGEAVEDWLVDLPDPMRRAVAFCSKIDESKRFADLFQRVVDVYRDKVDLRNPLRVECQHVDGSMDSATRKRKLRWLEEDPAEGECRVLANARCLSEGIDVPDLDAVLFMKPRKSRVDIIQAVGRVMRKAPGKRYGYVILPVVVPAGKSPEEALDDDKAFDVVWEVLQALRSHDERLDARINSLMLSDEGVESNILVDELGMSGDDLSIVQEKLDLGWGLDEWQDAMEAKLVKKCGTRVYWEDWADDVAGIASRHIERIRSIVASDERAGREFGRFVQGLRDSLNPGVTEESAIEMLAQHLITLPVFEALFGDASFAKSNPVSRAMEGMLDVLRAHAMEKREDDDVLETLYASVRSRVSVIQSDAGRQAIIKELYEGFFSKAFKGTSEKMGIVYTPNEIVDYILHATDRMLKAEFGEGLGSPGVHILDPFAGTGTFMAELIASDIISDEELPGKYARELHSNEILLLAYYIMTINIEQAYHSRMQRERERELFAA